MGTDVTLEALLPQSRAPAGARCATHPDREALGICARCGGFVCRAETIVYDRQAWCPKCCELPDVEWLEIYRRSRVGKISGGVVMVAVSAVVIAALGITILALLARQEGVARSLQVVVTVSAIAGALGVFNSVLYLRRWPPARVVQAICLAGSLPSFAYATFNLPLGDAPTFMTKLVLGGYVLFPLVVFQAGSIGSTRATLFFGGSVTRAKLIADYRAYGNNPAASVATMLGLFSIIVPLVCIPALLLARHAQRQVNPLGNPPVGRKADADAAVRFSIFGCVATVGWILGGLWLLTHR